MTEPRQIAVGDRVAFSARFLKDTLTLTGWRPFARGQVVSLDRIGGIVLADIRWDRPPKGNPRPPKERSAVNVSNLIHEDRIPFEGR